MQSQVKIFCCLALFVSTAVASTDWSTLETSHMQISPYTSAQGEVLSSALPFFIGLGRSIWGWDPKLALKEESDKLYTDKVYQDQRSSLDETMSTLFVNFDVSDTTQFRKVWFTPKPDLRFRGLFGIHDLVKKRPLVVLRLGIHGNIDELIAERFVAKALYDDLDVNVLVMESLTSHGFLSSNKKVSFGGIDEGLQSFFVLKELENTPLAKVTTSYHIVGVSMGGQGAFVTALLDENNGKQIKSIVDFCPLINLKETMDSHEQTGFKATLTDWWNTRRLKSLFDLYADHPELNDWWKSIFDLTPRFTKSVLTILDKERKEPLLSVSDMNQLVPGMKWPKGFAEHLVNSKSLLELNDFWPLYQGVKTPIMIYTTPNDPLVTNSVNSEKIFRGTQPGDFTSIKYNRLQRGVHCGLASVYKWNYVVKLLKEGLEL